jgi:hypothetical protein
MHVTQVDPEPVEARDNGGAVMTAPCAQGGRRGASNLRQERMDTQRPGQYAGRPKRDELSCTMMVECVLLGRPPRSTVSGSCQAVPP